MKMPVMVMTILVAAGVTAAEPRKLSGLNPGTFGVCGFCDPDGAFKISPDEQWVVYTQDTTTPNAFELWSAPIAGGPPVHLSSLLPAGSKIESFTVTDFQVTADGQRVVLETANPFLFHVFSVPSAGGGSLRRLDPSVATPFYALPDRHPYHSPIVLGAYTTNVLAADLYAVSASGGTATRLNGPLTTPERALEPHTLSTGEVVFVADSDVQGRDELWVASPPTFADGFEWGHAWSWSNPSAPPSCGHSACDLGAPLTAACSEKVATVCEIDSSCCSSGWTTQCRALYSDMFLLICL
jgi:hypothetical protein